MIIKEFLIRQYGPLAESGRVALTSFNLFWGENEDGKTLTMDAIIRLLFNKSKKIFPNIDRVSEPPDGEIILDNGKNETVVLPGAGQLSDILDISVSEFRNLFVVRDSDLSIAREIEFYGDITEKLTGLRTSQIEGIKSEIRKLGFLTVKLDTINTRKSDHLKERLQRAITLQSDCIEISEEALAAGYDRLEEELVRLQKVSQHLDRSINDMEKARLREKYTLAHQLLEKIKSENSALEDLSSLQTEEYDRWRQIQRSYEEKVEEKAALEVQHSEHREELETENVELAEIRQQVEITRRRKAIVDESLRPLLTKMRHLQEEQALLSAGRKFFQTALLSSVLISLALLTAVAFNPGVTLIIICAGFGAISLTLTLFYYFRFIRPAGELQQVEQQMIYQASELSLPGNTAPQVREQIKRLEDVQLRQQQRLAAAEGRIEFLKTTLKALRDDRIATLDKQLSGFQEQMEEIKRSTGHSGYESYQASLNQKAEHEKQLDQAISALQSLFGFENDAPQHMAVHQWQEHLNELKEYRDSAPDVKFNENNLRALKDELLQVDEKINRMRRQLREFREQLGEIERRANEILSKDEQFWPCRNLQDLQILQDQIQHFLDDIAHRQRIARAALDVFDDIEKDEQQKVSNLFGENSEVSSRYHAITDGMYQQVYFDPQEHDLRIKRNDGHFLSPAWLSGGAYDQLYFVIRLALAKDILPDQTGFIILDDPFLKSDLNRLTRQMDMLLELCQQGWQILYFSAKEEIRDVLKSYITAERVTLHSVPGVHNKPR